MSTIANTPQTRAEYLARKFAERVVRVSGSPKAGISEVLDRPDPEIEILFFLAFEDMLTKLEIDVTGRLR